MIDEEADFGDIADDTAGVKAAAKFRPNVRAKPRKPSVPSRPAVPNRSGGTTSEMVGALSQDDLSQGLATNQEKASSAVLDSETTGDAEAREVTTHTPSDDVLTVSAVDSISQNEDGSDEQPKVAAHQENLVVSDAQASSTHSVDDLADFGGLWDTPTEEERVAKFKPKIHVKLSKAASKSRKTDQKELASAVDVVSQNKEDSAYSLAECNDEQVQAPRHQERLQTSDSQPPLGNDGSTVDNFSDRDHILEEPVQEEKTAKLLPTSQRKPDVISQDDNHGEENSDLCQKSFDQEAATVTDTWPPHDINDIVDLDSQDELINSHSVDSQPIFGESSAEATAKFLPNVGRKNGKRKSVTFVLPDDSEVVAPTDTDSDDRNDISTDENLNTLPQQTAQKHCLTEELPEGGEYSDKESQYHEGALSDRGVKEQPKLNAGKLDLPMKLRNRRKEVGVSEHITDDNFDEEWAEPSAAEQDNDSGDEYTAGEKQKPKRKSRGKDPNKEPSRGSKRTSKNSTKENPAEQNQGKDKSDVPSRVRKRASKDALTEQPEKKKLTHRIRQKRTKVSEIESLLKKDDHEIDRMKLSVTHLRMLQEARERIQRKTMPSGPSSSNQSSQYGDTDDFDPFGDNYVNDRTENDAIENANKLNYHSYMNRQARARWTKSDTDLFYQGLQQFGSDFAMIQQLFPDKSRDQVRQKFKSEEKKHPMQVHDAILHRSRDNMYLKQVMKQLNIEDLQSDINSTDKQEVASNEGDTGNENVSHVINEEEDNGPNWSDEELDTHQSEVKEGDHVSGNAADDDDDDLDVFDWY